MQKLITRQIIEVAMSFNKYLALTKTIVESNAPQGIYANEKTHRYTRSNLERMNKVLQNTALHQKLYNLLSSLHENWIWLVLSEPWCGDASWGTPALYIISTASDKIDFRILLRDENQEIMNAYQTEGSDSIPKLICLKADSLEEIGTWGPRPAALQKMVEQWKQTPGIDYRESVRKLHEWYDQDMTHSIQDEITELVKKWKEVKSISAN